MTQRNDGGPACSQGADMSASGSLEAVGYFVRTKRGPDGKGGYLVAECQIGAGNGHEYALLFAAAPDMYEALKAVTDVLNEFREGGEYSGSMSIEAWPELRAAYAAIDKAEGKS